MKCPKLLDCIHDAQKCPSQSHPCSFKYHETLVRLKIYTRARAKALDCREIDFGYHGTSTSPEVFHHNWYTSMVSTWME
jgi:hypothetical protein